MENRTKEEGKTECLPDAIIRALVVSYFSIDFSIYKSFLTLAEVITRRNSYTHWVGCMFGRWT